MDKEIRSMGTVQVRSSENGEDSRIVEGYAVVWDTNSVDMGFIEQIRKGAIDQDVINRSDVFATLNHDATRGILARCYRGDGTLKLELDDYGLKYSFSAPRTDLGDEVLEMISRGDITASSFAFTVESDEWDYATEPYHRTVLKIDRLFDVSPVFEPAYEATSATTRKIQDVRDLFKRLSDVESEFDLDF